MEVKNSMSKIYPQIIDRFDGGLSEDWRVGISNKFALTKHFDTYTYPNKLVPHFSLEDDTVGATTYDIVKFLYAPAVGILGSGKYGLYGYGIDEGTTKPAIYFYNIDAGIPRLAGWAGAGTKYKEATITTRNEDVFFYYKNYIYFWAGNTNLLRYDTTQSDDVGSYKAIAYTNVAQPVHHPSDDRAYFFQDYNVHKLDGTTWDDGTGGTGTPVLILPTDTYITASCAYGNYLAIATCTLGTNLKSVVYLWDRDSSITTLSERIDFGRGKIVHLESLNNRLFAVMITTAEITGNNARQNIVIKMANGVTAIEVNRITNDGYTASLISTKFVTDNKLYFPASGQKRGDDRLGIWALDSNGKLSLEVVVPSATSYEGIYKVSDYWWIAHSNDGSIERTDNGLSYDTTSPSTYESLIFNAGDSGVTKKLLGVTAIFEPIQASPQGRVIVKYRKDEETSWTEILDTTEANAIRHSTVVVEDTGVNLPHFKEIQFQILSYGGAVITGLKFKAEIIEDDMY